MSEVANLRPERWGSEEMAEARLEGLAASFAAAERAAGSSSEDRFSIAGGSVVLRFASPALRERLTPAFEHCGWRFPRSQARPDRVPLGLRVDGRAAPAASGGARRPCSGRSLPLPRAAASRGVHAGPRDVERPRRGGSRAWHWVADAFTQPYWDQASPIRQILFWWLDSRDCIQVHGGAVGLESGGVLLVGKGGSGKSTVALSSLASELLYAGDDYVAVKPSPSPWVYSLYNSGKLEPHHVGGRSRPAPPARERGAA